MGQVAGSISAFTLIFQLGISNVMASCSQEPVAYYPLDGEHRFRESQNRTPPAEPFTNSPILAPGPDGNPAGSYQFNGSSGIVVENSPNGVLDVQFSITLMSWVYPDPSDNDGEILKYWERGDSLNLFFTTNGPISWIIVSRNGSQEFELNSTTVSLPSSTWSHVSASYDGDTGEANIFLNGSLVATQMLPTNIHLRTQISAFDIGWSYTGRITQARVYDVALSESEVQAVYQGGDQERMRKENIPPSDMIRGQNPFLARNLFISRSMAVMRRTSAVDICPRATVDCGYNETHISITIDNILDLPDWTGLEDEWRLNNGVAASCRPITFSGTTATYGPFVGDDCANITTSTDYLIYTFEITAEESGNSPTRRYDHDYIITCNYGRSGDVFSTFQPLHEQQDTAEGTSSFALYMQLYKDEDYTQLINDTVYLDEVIYVRIGVDHDFGEKVDLMLKTCNATSNEDGTNDVYTLIENSCDTGNDLTVNYNCDNQTNAIEEFYIQAFRYAGAEIGGPRSNIWFHCEVYVCLSANTSSVCQSLCADGCGLVERERRDAGKLQGETYQREISVGPFQFIDLEQQEQDVTQEKTKEPAKSSTKPSIIISVSGVVAMAIVCVTVFFVIRVRRQNSLVTEIPGTALENPVYEPGDVSNKF